MNSYRYWFLSVAGDAALAVLYYLWQFDRIEGAGNLFMFLIWLVIVIRFAVSGKKKIDNPPKRPTGFIAYHFLTEAIAIGALVWIGLFWTASFYVFALLLYEKTLDDSLKAECATEAKP